MAASMLEQIKPISQSAGDTDKKDKVDGVCGTYVVGERCIQSFGRKT
jgi:hypothetical protein